MNPVISNARIGARLLVTNALELLNDTQSTFMNLYHEGVTYMLDLDWNDKGGFWELVVFENKAYPRDPRDHELLGICAMWRREGDDPSTVRYMRYLDDDAGLNPKSAAARIEIERLLGITPGEPGEIIAQAA